MHHLATGDFIVGLADYIHGGSKGDPRLKNGDHNGTPITGEVASVDSMLHAADSRQSNTKRKQGTMADVQLRGHAQNSWFNKLQSAAQRAQIRSYTPKLVSLILLVCQCINLYIKCSVILSMWTSWNCTTW